MKSSLWHRLVHGTRRLWERPDWAAAAGADWADRIMEVTTSDDFHAKQGRSTARWLAQGGGRRLSVYLKRHYRLPWWRGLLAALFPAGNWSPAFQEWSSLLWAQSRGFRVPAPVAVAQYVRPGGRLQSVLAIEELIGMLPLHQAIPLAAERLAPAAFAAWKRLLIRELARVTADLHRRRRYHKDLYLGHFYLPHGDVERWEPRRTPNLEGRLHLIDLHRLAHHPWSWPLWQLKDVAQLLYSSNVEGVTARDRVQFWRLYRGGTPRTRWLRWIERCIRFKWLRYRHHNRKLDRRARQGQDRGVAA